MVAQDSYVSAATEQHLAPPHAVRKGMRLWSDDPIVLERPDVWLDAADDPETAELLPRPAQPVPKPAASLPPARKPGRPAWTDELVAERYQSAVHATPDPRTNAAIAEHFLNLDGRSYEDPKSLEKLLRKHRPKSAG